MVFWRLTDPEEGSFRKTFLFGTTATLRQRKQAPSIATTTISTPTMSGSNTRPPARRGPSGAWGRLRQPQIDPLEVYGLPSKGETRYI